MRATAPLRVLPQRLLLAVACCAGACTTVGPDCAAGVPWLNDWSSSALRSDAAEGQPRSRGDRTVVAQLQRSSARSAGRRSARKNNDVRTPAAFSRRAPRAASPAALYPQLQQLGGEVLRAGQQQSNGPDTAAQATSGSTSPGNWTSGASSGAASNPRMLPISRASPPMTTRRCWLRRRPPASTPPSAPSNCACALRTRTPRCKSAASRSPNACSRAATSPSSMSSRPGRST